MGGGDFLKRMNITLLSHEWLVLLLGIVVLLADLWVPAGSRRVLGYVSALGLGLILVYSFWGVSLPAEGVDYAFSRMYVLDGLALFFKRLFLAAGFVVLLMAVEFSGRLHSGHSEYFSLTLFALVGMLFAASVNDFALLFVSLELITVTFYILNSFQRGRIASLEAGVKYLIIGALSTGFTVFGIVLVFGTTGHLNFEMLAAVSGQFATHKLFLLGVLFVLVGLGFKIAAVPFQIWVPDVYQGAPTPSTAFLAIGSKAAGFVLLLRFLFTAVPGITAQWTTMLLVIAAANILYGNLGALPQRNLKRLLGYSSIAQAGYLLLGVAAMSTAGSAAVLYYFGGYLFTVLGAFLVIAASMPHADTEDISALAGLNQRAPVLAAGMSLAMVSLAGIPPLAGFFGKFLLLKAAFAEGPANTAYYWVAGIAVVGVVISLYYYFGVIRAIYWSRDVPDLSPIRVTLPVKTALYACMAGMLFIGLYPNPLLKAATQAVKFFK